MTLTTSIGRFVNYLIALLSVLLLLRRFRLMRTKQRMVLFYICKTVATDRKTGGLHKDGDGDASFQLKSDSLPHAHVQSTKTFYNHQDSRIIIMKAQELKTKTSAQTLIIKITRPHENQAFGGDCLAKLVKMMQSLSM
ncbi:hypothetical protein Tco_0838212 [Tanacetum coccineum]|uniref:Uncharacterized protein n=1 Tax=Tanacetum coccineum TaxID=301880 RepID=A0ABQ5AM69_9ASTR